MTEAELAVSRRRVQRFFIAIVSLVVAAGGVKLVDFMVERSERTHQEECLENLRAICFAERMVQAQGSPFITRVANLPAPVPRGNRFAYFLSTAGPMEDRWPDAGAPATDTTAVGDPTGWDAPQGMKLRVVASDLPVAFLGDAGLGPSTACPGPACQFVSACAGNLDVDDDLDVWSASTQPRTAPSGATVSACEPFHERIDLGP